MRNGYVRLGQFLSFFAGVVCGTADFGDQKWWIAGLFFLAAIVIDVIAINYVDKGVREVAEKTRQDLINQARDEMLRKQGLK
ncbi:hypothetical protein PP460_gp030 [Streptomyces phage Muntaha]|uniref:Uncharacterized protein n=1 Tax=Streptomyces phage Muntaha TaxID=2713269 RepID=A0A6G8R3K1_9CAUD|nr:hypothetical protein PP460_gp030 [Streptomyces phage Muntaha]QIN94772.1 hypothetical protein SEA_MUNTAHA_249 [Streptomyces phage Muntaha]